MGWGFRNSYPGGSTIRYASFTTERIASECAVTRAELRNDPADSSINTRRLLVTDARSIGVWSAFKARSSYFPGSLFSQDQSGLGGQKGRAPLLVWALSVGQPVKTLLTLDFRFESRLLNLC